jgi:hypothetical protein
MIHAYVTLALLNEILQLGQATVDIANGAPFH